MKLSHILVATDFSPISRRATEAGVALARKTKARLTIIHVLPSVVPIYSALPSAVSGELAKKGEAARQVVQKRLARLVADARKRGARADAVLEEGDPVARIVHLAKKRRATLVILGTHGRGAAAHLLLGSVARKVLHEAPCSVMVVKRAKWREKGRVLIALDLSPMARKLFKHALQIAKGIGARPVVLHAIHDTGWVAEAIAAAQPDAILDAITEMGFDRARKGIARAIAGTGASVKPADILIREGRPQDVIVRESARGVMLTIVGTHGRKGASRLFLGSVAEAVVLHARSPVLVLKGIK